MSTEERWLPIQRFERYEVSDQGRVRGPNGLVRPRIRSHGYFMVAFSRGRQQHHYLVHRLVLIAFVGHPARGQVACHNNGQKRDNRLENLRWDTQSANIADAFRHGTMGPGTNHGSPGIPKNVGAKHGRAKLTEADVLEIRTSPARGIDLAAKFGVSRSLISQLRGDKRWAHVKVDPQDRPPRARALPKKLEPTARLIAEGLMLVVTTEGRRIYMEFEEFQALRSDLGELSIDLQDHTAIL